MLGNIFHAAMYALMKKVKTIGSLYPFHRLSLHPVVMSTQKIVRSYSDLQSTNCGGRLTFTDLFGLVRSFMEWIQLR